MEGGTVLNVGGSEGLVRPIVLCTCGCDWLALALEVGAGTEAYGAARTVAVADDALLNESARSGSAAMPPLRGAGVGLAVA